MTAAARKRAQRAREELGRIVVPVEVDQAALSVALVDVCKFVTPNEQDHPRKRAFALSRLVGILIGAPVTCDDAVLQDLIGKLADLGRGDF